MGDDANFSTTVTNSIATKMPLSGGTFTGGVSHSGGGNDAINFTNNTSNDSRGISFNGRTALSADNVDGYLRLNNDDEFSNGVYTPGHIRADGGFNVDGTVVINNNATIPSARLTGALPALDGSSLTGIVSFVSGMIILWSGSTGSIPSGWVLCNGSNSTPDLRDRFVVGAGNSYSVGATGGSVTATDTVTISGSDTVNISVSVSGSTGFEQLSSGGNHVSTGASNRRHTHSFSGSGSGSDTVNISGSDTVSIDTRSPYYALAYIMKT